MYLVHTMSTFSLFLKKTLIIFLFLFNNFLIANKIESISVQDAGFSKERLNKIDETFIKAIQNKEIPGAVIAISRYGKIVYKRAFGMQDPQKQIPMTEDSIFRIYSMTKPIISTAAMMLNEDGLIYLHENLNKYIPEFDNMTVSTAYIDKEGQKQERVVEAKNKIKIHNLLNHTSGLTYGTFGNSFAKKRLKSSEISKLNLEDISLKKYVKELSKFPLAYNPNTVWEYGRSIEVLGRVVEIVSNKTLDVFLKDKIFKPLDMIDTAFYVDESKWHRIAEPFKDKQPKLINIRDKPNFLTGGHGLVSTIDDYMKFCMMFLKKGKVNNNSILSRKTIEYMTSNHLGNNISRDTPLYLPGPGYGFGLGFAVRESNGLSSWPGSKGEYFWAGYAGTYFWIDPKEELIVISMTQSVTNRMKFRLLLRNLVYQAIIN